MDLSGEDQLSALLSRPGEAIDWIEFKKHFSRLSNWELVRENLATATDAKQIGRVLWFLSAFPSAIPGGLLNESIMPLLGYEDSLVRSQVLEIVFHASSAASIESVVRGGWNWSATNFELENHWGSLVLCEHGASLPFEEICRRVRPTYLASAVLSRGNQPTEVQVLAKFLHEIWLHIGELPDLPLDLPEFTVDASASGEVEHLSRRGLPKDIFSQSVRFINPDQSWGGLPDQMPDLNLENVEQFQERQRKLIQILREAVAQQAAAGNAWFGEVVYPNELQAIIEQYPDLVRQWVQAATATEPEAYRRLRLCGSFYGALCVGLLGKDTQMATSLYWRLQKAGTRVHVVDHFSGVEFLDLAFFNAEPDVNLRGAWSEKLEQATTDQELLRIAFLAQHGKAKNWLLKYVAEGTGSPIPISKARSIILLGFSDDQETLGVIDQLLQTQPETWIGDLAKASKQRWNKNSWSKHWFHRFLTASDDATAWASFRLFLLCIDSRFWLWGKRLEVEVGDGNVRPERLTFLRDNLENIRDHIQKNEKEMADQFLGQKILEREVWPWMSSFTTHL